MKPENTHTEAAPAADNSGQTTQAAQHTNAVPPVPRHHRRGSADDKYFKIRNILNIIFMLGAIVGMAVFYLHDRTLGTIIILTAMAFKIAECCFRFIRQ